MQLGRAIHRGNPRSSRSVICGLLLVASIAMLPKLWLVRDNSAWAYAPVATDTRGDRLHPRPASARIAASTVALSTIAPEVESKYALAVGKPRPVEAVLSIEIRAPKLAATEWEVFAARPPTLGCQTEASVRLVPGGRDCLEAGPLARPLVRARLVPGKQATGQGFSVRLEYKALLASRRLVSREPGVRYHVPERLSPAEREAYASANELYDFKMPAFQQWLRENRLLRQPSEGDTDFARRVFLALKPKLRYEYRRSMDRRATNVCRALASDCGGMSLLYASVLRASGLPARVIAGRWAVSSKPGAVVGEVNYYQQHVKAEFYAGGVGWVPVDLSGAVQHDPSPEGLRYFGSDRGNFLTVHVDPLLVVEDSRGVKRTYNLLQSIHYRYRGKGDQALTTEIESWKVWWPERTLSQAN